MPNETGDWQLVPQDQQVRVVSKIDDLLKILQNLDISISARKDRNILIIQTVKIGSNDESNNFITELISQNVSWGEFKKKMQKMYFTEALKQSKSITEAAKKLQVPRPYFSRLKADLKIGGKK